MKKIITLFLVTILLFTTTAFAEIITQNEKQTEGAFSKSNVLAKWTIMYYMCGDNMGMDVYIDPLLENLSNIGSDENLNIVALSDKPGHGNSKLYYFNETGSKIELNQVYGWPSEVNTNNLNTLELFCIQMMNAYSAKHYALVTYTAGGMGWQEICLADKDDPDTVITYPNFAQSLEKIVNQTGNKLDVFVGSCAINMVEVGYELAPYVDYIVGTQDCFLHDHVVPMFYEALIDLKNNSDLTPEEFAIRSPVNYEPVAFIYEEGYGRKISVICKLFDKLPFPELHSVIHYSNIGVINNSQITKLVEELGDLASMLALNSNDDEFFSIIRKTRKEVQELGKCAPISPYLYNFYRKFPFEFLAFDCYVDLYDLIRLFKENTDNNFIKNKCDLVLEQINKTIPLVSGVENVSCCGMNIYFPKNSFFYNKYKSRGKIPSPYEELKFSEDSYWDEFLKTYLKI